MELNTEFYNRLLTQIEELYSKNNLSICEYRKHNGDRIKALSRVQINPMSQGLEFVPLAFLWDKNPMLSMKLAERPVLAIQKPISEWEKEAKEVKVSSFLLN